MVIQPITVITGASRGLGRAAARLPASYLTLGRCDVVGVVGSHDLKQLEGGVDHPRLWKRCDRDTASDAVGRVHHGPVTEIYGSGSRQSNSPD